MDRSWQPAELTAILGSWMTGPGPLYGRLAAALDHRIHSGDLAPGDRLPSERALATALSVSRATVVSAYDDLRSAGAVDSRRGSGTRIAVRPGPVRGADGRVPGGSATALVQRLVDGPSDMISLAMASFGAAPQVREALDHVTRIGLESLLTDTGYHPRGLPLLRETVADHYSAQGLPTTPGQILITTGATQALALTAQLYVRRGSPIVVETPSWPGCLDAFLAAGARPRRVPLDEDGIRLDGLAEALPGAALLHVTPTFHNPTGTLMSASRRRRLAELACRHGVPLVEDMAYDTRLTDAPEPPPVAAFAPPGTDSLTIGSLTKAVWSGLRIGWLRGPAGTVERLARLKALADMGTPVLDQALAARLLPRLDDIKHARAHTLRAGLTRLESLLADRLPDWTWHSPTGGAALWTRLPHATDADVFAQVALRHGVEVVPGSATDPSGAHNDHIRVPFALPADRLDELVRRLSAAWAELAE
ncbi:PLP-dependent aminotransferase family protein [Streptomyces sp. NBC_01142]|uniref:aminotransferase-like domain-containing protein n=1 Tax=Streptomyces sp. NBC_01142 TaxID=2975865 RepID=UPI00225AE871|nr:PLP-dependent aminotransferase family protein [Streptomyces sp. NBC_01142]MCX4821282.1 PLP-dependent aminotransferase family protein [Streptomyces sp. NBC_01142]